MAAERDEITASKWRPEAVVFWILTAAGVIGVGLAIRAMFITGIAWDALFDAEVSITNRSIDPDTTSLAQAYELARVTSEFYGLLHFQIAEILHAVVTQTTEWMSPDDPSTYVWQNSIILIYAVISSGALALAVARTLSSRIAGAFTWAILMTTPLWLGMSVIDYKDVPVASGLTLISAGLMWSWSANKGRDQVVAVILAALGGVVALGGRAGSWPLILGVLVGTLVLTLVAQIWMRQPRRVIPIAAIALTTPAIAALTMWLTNPIARINLTQWLWDSFTVVRKYEWVGLIRAAGQDVQSDQLPWWYAPAWLAANLPLLSTACLMFGLACFVISGVRSHWGVGRAASIAFAPLVIQGVVLPLVIVGSGAVLYDGIRHLLFIFPPIAAFMAVGIVTLQRELSRPALASVVALVVVGASLFAVVRWYPYHYAFINPLAGSNKAERQWELDYWGLTAREGVARLKAVGLDPIAVIPASEPGRPYGGLTLDEVNAIAPPPQRSGIYAFLRWDSRILEKWCGVTFTITRDGQTLGQGGYCPK